MPLRTGVTDRCTQCHLSIINLVKNRREAKITMCQLQIEGENCSLECKSEMTRRKWGSQWLPLTDAVAASNERSSAITFGEEGVFLIYPTETKQNESTHCGKMTDFISSVSSTCLRSGLAIMFERRVKGVGRLVPSRDKESFISVVVSHD